MKYLYPVLVACLFFSSCLPKAELLSEEIDIRDGSIKGTRDPVSGVLSFKGIPFAAPPLGELRWKAPQPPEPWEGVMECKAFGASPMQAKPRPFMYWSEEFLIPEDAISEDCLYLNVWTSAERSEDQLPVLVYIYGGGFRSGGSGCAIYDGQAMAKKGIVFVSLNYRVGTFGFLAHPGLTAESAYGSSGNYGILDMIAGLEWVRDNIAAFGGDPGNVTIAGQSAGAFAVSYLTASPLASGLFHRAIAQSGAAFLSSPLRPGLSLEDAEKAGEEFAASFEVSSISELREVPSDSLLHASGGLVSPFIDGYVIPRDLMTTYLEGKQNDVPVLIGWNKEDALLPGVQPAALFRQRIHERFAELAADFFRVYPADSEEEARVSQLAMSRDESFGIQVYSWANTQLKTGSPDIYLYNFNRSLPAYDEKTAFGAFHSGEIVYAYDNLHTLDRPWEEADHLIAALMSAYWANFARSGNPNGEGLPRWSAYTAEEKKVMLIDTLTKEGSLPNLHQLEFWENYYQQADE